MVDWRKRWEHALRSPEEAVAQVEPGSTLVIPLSHGHGPALIRALVAQQERFDPPVRIYTGAASLGVFDYTNPGSERFFNTHTLHPGKMLMAVEAGRAKYVPVDNLEFGRLLDQGLIQCDTALIQVSPPDAEGYCSLGLAVGVGQAVLRRAHRIIAQVNESMPYTYGETRVHASRFDLMVDVTEPLLEWGGEKPPGPAERQIADYVSQLVPDGASLQVGIGSLADAVLAASSGKRDLRVLSGLVSSSVAFLAEAGGLKTDDGPAIRTTSVIGSQDLYRWCHRQELLHVESTERLHRAAATVPRFVAVNSALDLDLTGQVNIETIGPRLVGGVGGHLRFMMAASESPGGRGIVALSSVSSDGRISRIKASLNGAPVATPRSCVHYVVTEYGIADLQGKTLQERAEAMIAIAHPSFRTELREAMKALL